MTTSPQRENESTRQYVTRLMEEAVALKGEDYVYYPQGDESDKDDPLGTTCFYILDGQPSCIVGHVLVAAGVDPKELSSHEGTSAYSVARTVPAWGDDNELRSALRTAQTAQDGGETWGMALRRFKEELGVT